MDKRVRYITTVITLDKIDFISGLTSWDSDGFYAFLNEQEKHSGLKLISSHEEILVVVEYINIIWEYKIFYGSYKKKYTNLIDSDERWTKIETQLETDLKTIGLEELKEEILLSLKLKKYFERKLKINKQFKNYCI